MMHSWVMVNVHSVADAAARYTGAEVNWWEVNNSGRTGQLLVPRTSARPMPLQILGYTLSLLGSITASNQANRRIVGAAVHRYIEHVLHVLNTLVSLSFLGVRQKDRATTGSLETLLHCLCRVRVSVLTKKI